MSGQATTAERRNLQELSTQIPDRKSTAQEASEQFDVGTIDLSSGLNTLLADEYALFTKTLNYHWNVTGPRFYSVHEFLENQYRDLLEVIDDVAERIREIGKQPMGTLSEFSIQTHITERPGVHPETSAMIADLKNDHDLICSEIRRILADESKAVVDPGTEDFLTGLLKKHEEMAWMLKSTLN
jgi:starvation-inducible DNA-binding protein